MNDQPQGSQSRIVAGIAGGFGLLLFLLIAGFAGERLANVGEPSWMALVALLAVCGTLAIAGSVAAWRQHRQIVTNVDPNSLAGLRQRSEAYGAVAGICMMLFFALPLVLVRQMYWPFAPWAALLSALTCASTAVWAWRVSLRLQDEQYRAMSPPQLWQELQRYPQSAGKHARRFMIIAGVFALAQLIFLFAGLLLGWTGDTFPPRTVREWTPWLQALYLPSFALAMWSRARIMERWRQTFHVVRR